ncbi:MAG: ATP-binding cassette domain-containing protein [Deltaproteobacteria bacterium]|nr:ATP-binding cassette domain-containing protein [Candidatus Anaeroferrophillacea bacterium]
MANQDRAPVIAVRHLHTRFGDNEVHRDLNFSIDAGQIVAIIGESGTGKSVLLKEIIGLLQPTSGATEVFGVDMGHAPEEDIRAARNRFGVLFQNGALFSALTAGENIAVPLWEQTDLPAALVAEQVELRLALTGLSTAVAGRMPADLSGGMKKRVALARALVLEPELLFLDEPTSGLDPINARSFDRLVRTLCDNLGLTIVLVTHDLDTLNTIVDRVVVLGRRGILADGPPAAVRAVPDPWIREYFRSGQLPASPSGSESTSESKR